MDRELAIGLVVALLIMAATARTPILERTSIVFRKLFRFVGRTVAGLVLVVGVVVIVSEVATWRGRAGDIRADAPFYSLLLWLALLAGPIAFLAGLAWWSRPGALPLRIVGWLLMAGALSVSSLSDMGLLLMIVLTTFLQQFTQPLSTKPIAESNPAVL